MNVDNLDPNQKVKALVKPIAEQFENEHINKADLEEIGYAVHKLWKGDVSNLWEPISEIKAREMIAAYEDEFGGDILMDKSFKISYTLLSELLNQEKDLVLKFAQLDVELNLLYEDENGSQRLLIDPDTSAELAEEAVDAFRRNFYSTTKGLKKKLDASITRMFNDGLKHENTRQITIPYLTNFDHFDPDLYKGIVLLPAIDNNTTNLDKLHKITFVMYFEAKDSTVRRAVYYDMMQLCPPGSC